MADYTYDSELVADPFSFQRAANASITVYDADDENETTPLVLKDLTGLPLPNPLASNADAFVPAFIATSAQVKMVGGGLRVVRASFQGVRDEAVAAKLAAAESKLAAQAAADEAADTVTAALAGAVADAEDAAAAAADAAALVGAPADAAIAAAVSGTNSSTRAALAKYAATNTAYLDKWFAGGIRGKKIVFVGDSTTDFAYALTRAMNYYVRRGRELAGVAFLNYGVNGQTLAGWTADTSGRYGITSTVAQNADLYVLSYGINDVRTGAMTEDTLVTNLSAAVDSLRANGTSTVLLRMPPTFTATDTGALGFVTPNGSAQAYSTLLRNAYIRVAAAKGCALLDTQALVYGLTSKPDTQSPYMLNQIHPNDAGNNAVARELVKMIGVPATTPPASFLMQGKVAVGTIGTQTFPNGGRVAFGLANYRPINASGSLTIELRKFPANTVIGTVTYSGGFGSGNVMVPSAAAVEWATLSPGDSVQVAVTACTVATYDLEVLLLADVNPPASVYPLQLRGSGLVSALDGSVVYPATETLTTDAERTIGNLKAVAFKRLGYNRFTQYSQDATKTAAWTTSNVTITGSPGAQTLTATATGSIAALKATVTAGEQLTFSWRATTTGTPKYAVYDLTHATFVVASTSWPAADANGWRHVTVTVPAGCTTLRCYPLSASTAIGDAITLTGMQLTAGASFAAHAPTNSIGTAMTVNTGALPSEFTIINLLKLDAYNGGASVASPGGPNTDGNPALQIANSSNFGYPVITPRGVAPRGANGAWQTAVLRVTGGNTYATLNDQAQSPAFAKAVNATDLRWNYLNATDTTGAFQNWDGEVIAFYFPYLLTEGEAAAFVRSKLLTLRGNGETITADWPAQKLS